jgi:hypothetical protein
VRQLFLDERPCTQFLHSFLDDIERIGKKDYLPSDTDILRARLRTVGVQEHKLSLELGPEKGQDWYIYDVGGSRSQRSAWESFFDDGASNAINTFG